MSKNKELGQEGEQIAANYLQKKGWKIHELNYRYSHSEIDLIVSNNDLLVFVEVKPGPIHHVAYRRISWMKKRLKTS